MSQFTLYGSCNKGSRLEFLEASHPEKAEKKYHDFAEPLKRNGIIPKLGIAGILFTNFLKTKKDIRIYLD